MFLKWMKFSRDAARLGYEVQTVMTLRLLKFARGGKAAKKSGHSSASVSTTAMCH